MFKAPLASFPGRRRNGLATSVSSNCIWMLRHSNCNISLQQTSARDAYNFPAVRMGLLLLVEATVCCPFYYWSEIEVVRTKIIMQSAYTSTIERSLLKWNGRDCDGSMHYAIGFYCCHVTMFWNLIGTANFQAAAVTVWTGGSCQAVSPMAWQWGYNFSGSLLALQWSLQIKLSFYACTVNSDRGNSVSNLSALSQTTHTAFGGCKPMPVSG